MPKSEEFAPETKEAAKPVQAVHYDATPEPNAQQKEEDDVRRDVIKLGDLVQRLSDNDIGKLPRKKRTGGGFLEPIPISDEGNDYAWVCHNRRPRDFETLVRFTVMAKLSNNCSMHVRTFISKSNEYIFAVLKSSEEQIQREAIDLQFSSQLEFGLSDLMSLEPCDDRNRPLRLKKQLREQIYMRRKNDSSQEGEQPPAPSDQQKQDAKQSIEMKARELIKEAIDVWDDDELWDHLVDNQIVIDQELKYIQQKLKIDLIAQDTILFEDEPVSIETWQAYYLYQEYQKDYFKRCRSLLEKSIKVTASYTGHAS